MDSDCIDGTLMPAVDDPSPDGFSQEEARELLRPIVKHERALGLQVTIYDPTADPAGRSSSSPPACCGNHSHCTAPIRPLQAVAIMLFRSDK